MFKLAYLDDDANTSHRVCLALIIWVAINRIVERITMIVDIAAIVGSMKSLSELNICFVSVAVEPPETNIEIITSSNEERNDRRAAVITENLI